MVNGSWLMAQGWSGAWPEPQCQGARSNQWAMSHEALTINNNRLINASFEYIYIYIYIYIISIMYQVVCNSNWIQRNSEKYQNTKKRVQNTKTHLNSNSNSNPSTPGPPSKLSSHRSCASRKFQLGPSSLGCVNHVPMLMWQSNSSMSSFTSPTTIASTWTLHQMRWSSQSKTDLGVNSPNWTRTHWPGPTLLCGTLRS